MKLIFQPVNIEFDGDFQMTGSEEGRPQQGALFHRPHFPVGVHQTGVLEGRGNHQDCNVYVNELPEHKSKCFKNLSYE